jgi:hypothetical protein
MGNEYVEEVLGWCQERLMESAADVSRRLYVPTAIKVGLLCEDSVRRVMGLLNEWRRLTQFKQMRPYLFDTLMEMMSPEVKAIAIEMIGDRNWSLELEGLGKGSAFFKSVTQAMTNEEGVALFARLVEEPRQLSVTDWKLIGELYGRFAEDQEAFRRLLPVKERFLANSKVVRDIVDRIFGKPNNFGVTHAIDDDAEYGHLASP